MKKTKKLAFPLYVLTDEKRPIPNFIADTTVAKGWALAVFSCTHKASFFAKISGREGARVLLLKAQAGLSIVLGSVKKTSPWVETMVLDPPLSDRRPKKRFLVPISEYLETNP